MVVTNKMTLKERKLRLNRASENYIRGKITPEQFEDAERQFAPNLRVGIDALAAEQLKVKKRDRISMLESMIERILQR